MKVRMLRLAAGPEGVFKVGESYEVQKLLGLMWVEMGVAEAEEDGDVRDEAPPIKRETATKGPEEKAVLPRGEFPPVGKRGRRRGSSKK